MLEVNVNEGEYDGAGLGMEMEDNAHVIGFKYSLTVCWGVLPIQIQHS